MSADLGAPAAILIQGRRVAPGTEAGGEFTYSITDVTTSRPRLNGERRSDRRVNMRLHEGLIGERASGLVDCRIRDRSRYGVRLQLLRDCTLPRCFMVTDTATKTRFRAQLVWQRGREAGVRVTPDKGGDRPFK